MTDGSSELYRLVKYQDLYSYKIDLAARLAIIEASHEYWAGIERDAYAHTADTARAIEELAAELANVDAHISFIERELPNQLSHSQYTRNRRRYKQEVQM